MSAKLRKFLKNPSGFTVDMARKKLRVHPAGRVFSGRYKSTRRYSIVSAVYQVEKYLDNYLQSLANQTLSFEKNIELILVDDGSKDASADIARKWMERYPNIRLIQQKNGGASAARNAGIPHVTNDWVTFIDPDDILDARYFEEVDRFLDKYNARDVGMIGTNLHFFLEKNNAIRNGHSLNFKFRGGDKVFPIKDLTDHIHLSVATAFFRRKLIEDKGILFDTRIKPSFEDAHFIGQYLLEAGDIDVGFAPKAVYYYRKREDKSSALDTSWQKPERFSGLMRHGCLDLLERARPFNAVWAQNMALYHMMWDIRHLINHPERLSFLTDAQKKEYFDLCRQCFALIDRETILTFDLANCDYFLKTALLGFFKSDREKQQRVYIDEYDAGCKLLKLRHFYTERPPAETVQVNGETVEPIFLKTRSYELVGPFAYERILWIPFDANDVMTAMLDGEPVSFYTRSGYVGPIATAADIRKSLSFNVPQKMPAKCRFLRMIAKLSGAFYKDIWLFMDRDIGADDNAEHLYRHMQNDPGVRKAFILSRSSPDWKRLARDKFRLIPFGSLRHMVALLHAKHLISSHADNYVTSYLSPKWFGDMLNHKFTFLQHGVTQGDLSDWLNTKPIHLLVTTTPDETAAFIHDGNKYKFTSKEIALTGFARHDRLHAMADKKEKLVVIMPTWRKFLVGQVQGKTNNRHINPDFFQSGYAKAWKSFLHAPQLKMLAEKHGYRFLFAPHQNILPYIDGFAVPEWMEVFLPEKGKSMQDIFCRAAIMVTDYSSVAFESGFLQRPVIYYQFDRDEFFSGQHISQKGYFEYETHGFGPVCLDEQSLIEQLTALITADGVPDPVYKARMENAFPYTDGGACDRIVSIIRNM